MGSRKAAFDHLLLKAKSIVDGPGDNDGRLTSICKLLKENVDYYDWVGFYIVNGKKRELVLGPFVGEPTEHVRIQFGKGICGQAAERKTPFLVQDVSKEANYLSCSLKVRSEIVIPIFRNNQIVGELDIDSNTLSPFTHEDTEFLEALGRIASEVISSI